MLTHDRSLVVHQLPVEDTASRMNILETNSAYILLEKNLITWGNRKKVLLIQEKYFTLHWQLFMI